MAFDDTHCPCTGRKAAGYMLCFDCETALAATPEMTRFRDPKYSVDGRRSAAIRLLAMARRRRSTDWRTKNQEQKKP